MSLFDYRGSAGSSSPSTLAQYLDSLGITWYGGFRRGLNQFSSYANQDTPANTLGNSVGQWAPNWTAGGFSAKFIQTTNSKRPSYMSSFGTTGIMGDATTTWLNLDSTSALNRDHTVLIATTMPVLSSARTYSQNVNRMGLISANAGSSLPRVFSDNNEGPPANPVMACTYYDASSTRYKIGWRSAGTGYYDNAPNLFRSSSAGNYSEALISELWLIGGQLTNDQISQCLPFLVL